MDFKRVVVLFVFCLIFFHLVTNKIIQNQKLQYFSLVRLKIILY